MNPELAPSNNNSINQNWKPWLFLLAAFTVGFVLRFLSLDKFPPQIDEYSHTHTAIEMIRGNDIDYFRALVTVTFPVFLFFKAFGISLLTARLPMIILNMLAIIPLFSLSNKIRPNLGYVSVLLYLVNPWIIASSQLVREYAVVPIFIYSTLFILSSIVTAIAKKETFNNYHFSMLIFASILLFYFPIFDRSSIISIIMGIYVVFFIHLFIHYFFDRTFSSFNKSILFLLTVIVVGITLFESGKFKYFLKTGSLFQYPTTIFLDSLVNNPYQHWNYYFPQIGIIFLAATIIVLFWSIFNLKQSGATTLFLISLSTIFVISYLSLIMFNSKVGPRVRYGVLIIYFILPIVSLLFIKVFSFITKPIKNYFVRSILFVVFFSAFWINVPSLQKLILYEGGESHFITNNHHYIAEPAYRFLSKRMQDQQPMLSNDFFLYNELRGNELGDPIFINFNKIKEKQLPISEVLSPYKSGWVALYEGAYPQEYGFPLKDFISGNKVFEYLGSKGDVFLWSWSTID